MDIYLAFGTAGVTITGGDENSVTEATPLVLDGAAKISGITGNTTTGSIAVANFLIKGTGNDLSAVTGAVGVAGTGNYIGVKSGEAYGILVVANDADPTSNSAFAPIVIATVANATSA